MVLTEAELGAVLQDTLTESEDNPIRRVDLTIVDGEGDQPGHIDFTVAFKNGSLTGDGRIGATLDAGQIDLEIQDVSLGRLSLPGIATGAMEDLVESVLDLNERLAESKADIQLLDIGEGRVHVVGTQGEGELLTAGSLLSAIASNAESLSGATTPPAEVIGPGTVNSTSADGDAYVVAIGDSIATTSGCRPPTRGWSRASTRSSRSAIASRTACATSAYRARLPARSSIAANWTAHWTSCATTTSRT